MYWHSGTIPVLLDMQLTCITQQVISGSFPSFGYSGLQTIRHYIQAEAREIHFATGKAFDFVANNAAGSY